MLNNPPTLLIIIVKVEDPLQFCNETSVAGWAAMKLKREVYLTICETGVSI